MRIPKSSPQSNPNTNFPGTSLATKFRKLVYAATALTALNNTACSSDDSTAEPEPKAWGCISVLDQETANQEALPRTDCTFDYKLSKEGRDFRDRLIKKSTEGEDAGENEDTGNSKTVCNEGELFIYGAPGTHTIQAECDKLHGYIKADLYEGENTPKTSHLIGSMCYNPDDPIVTDPLHRTFYIIDDLGTHTDTRCANWFGYEESAQTVISNIQLDCPKEEADAGTSNCDPTDGRDYLVAQGEWSEYMAEGDVESEKGDHPKGVAMHLVLEAQTQKVTAGEEVKVWVSTRMKNKPEQELKVPVIIRGPKAN